MLGTLENHLESNFAYGIETKMKSIRLLPKFGNNETFRNPLLETFEKCSLSQGPVLIGMLPSPVYLCKSLSRMHKLKVPDHVVAPIRSMHPHLKKKIRGSLQAILCDSHSGKALKDDWAGLRSFRVSRFRIVYRISKRNRIEVVAIGPRQRIYEETFRIISKEKS